MKSNLGHLEGASGLASIIKTVLVLEKGLIPPNANFEQLNPQIDVDFLKLKVCHSPYSWSFLNLLVLFGIYSLALWGASQGFG